MDHKNVHDIFLANMGITAIEALSVELVSDVVELDSYWTLKGIYDLEGFSGTSRTKSYGELPNLEKIRLRTKEIIDAGADITGTSTIKSGTTALVVLNLTGTIGDPVITTPEIPQAVKYVHYGTVIQNNNKYSWNRVSYQFVSGLCQQEWKSNLMGRFMVFPLRPENSHCCKIAVKYGYIWKFRIDNMFSE